MLMRFPSSVLRRLRPVLPQVPESSVEGAKVPPGVAQGVGSGGEGALGAL